MIKFYKKSFWFFFVLFCSIVSRLLSQPYGNEWINFDNTYFRFSIHSNGFYRVSYSALNDAGIPVDTLNPKTIKIFRNGLPVNLYIQGDQDYSFDPGDFVEFYGKKNDGYADGELYATPTWQANTNYSLFNDTAVYFLTWDDDISYDRYYEETDTAFSGYPPLSYVLKEQRDDYTSQYFGGPFTPANIYNSPYEETEGWFGPEFTVSYSDTVKTDNIYTGIGSPDAVVNIVLAMANNNDHIVNIQFGSINDFVTGNKFENNFLSYALPPSSLTEGATQFNFYALGNTTGTNPDRNTVAWISVKYPHTMDLNSTSSFRFFVPYNASKSHLAFTGFNSPGGTLLYDLTGRNRIIVIKNGNSFHALAPSGGEKECVIASENTVQYITDIRKVETTGKFTDYENDIANYNYLIITHKSLWAEAVEYAGHRSSTLGGGYNPLVVDVEELYGQFIYGIRKHPLAIRHFVDFIMDKWDTLPRALFLLGKSVEADISRISAYAYSMNLVPTFGYPPSDNMLTAGLNGSLYEPAIPTGRLAAKTGMDVVNYKNKVVEYEGFSQKPAEWMKKVVHFGGGKTQNEQQAIQNILAGYQTIIEDTNFGGKVYPFLKTSPDPIQPEIAQTAIDLINNGISIMTFVGHSSQSGFDVNIESPSKYSNDKGKYPFLMAIGCFVGNIHTLSTSFSEQWVLSYPYGGDIGFFASTSLGELSPLAQYLSNVYFTLGKTYYGSPIGKIIQEAIRATQDSQNTIEYIRSFQDMTLHGDPAMIIHSPLEPDLTISQEEIFFTPPDVSTDRDSFNMKVVVTNLGRGIKKPFPVDVMRHFQLLENPAAPVTKFHPQSLFKDTVILTFPVDQVNGPGLNSFDIEVNKGAYINEKTYNNNSATAFLFIRSDDIVPVYPPEFAIIPNNTVTLNASTGYPFAGVENYIFQIDTNGTFASPLASQTISQSGGVVKWTPPMTFTDSTVYFWRVGKSGSGKWRGSSFEYIKDKYGWGQSHFNQFLKNDYLFVEPDSIQHAFNFVPAERQLFCRTVGNYTNGNGLNDTRYYIDMVWGDKSGCCDYPSLIVAVIDSLTLLPWQAPWNGNNTDHEFNQVNGAHCTCPQWPYAESYFIYWSGPADDGSRTDMANMLVNNIPDGNYVLIYSLKNPNISYWNSDLLLSFKALGADTNELKDIPNDNPFIFLCRKGDVGYEPILIWGSNPGETLTLDTPIISKWRYGYIITPVIGPSAKWESLHWRVTSVEPNDDVFLKATGITTGGITNIINGFDSIDASVPGTLSLSPGVDAAINPNLKITLNLHDDLLKTPAQIKSWRILYEGVPEAAINPYLFHFFLDDTLQEGATLQCTTAVQNISYYNMDSLRVHWWITDADNKSAASTYKKLEPLPSNDFLLAPFSYNTLGLTGINSLWMEVNPRDSLWQLEQSHFNNIAQLSFYVDADRINPLLDVTFDGVHILNGDIVSATPDILIQLKDENRYLVLNDSSRLDVYIKIPGAQEVKIPFDGVTLLFIPATLPDNKAKVNYRPVFTKDGTYQLRVNGKDASNNRSGDIDYIITFEVITRPSITYFLNWPNPFSTSTRFVFTLTGSEVPDQIRIRIMTVSGKVVREIFGWEMGSLHIGRNITEFAWDGTDQWGDRLANGVYLYKVDVRLNGETIEHRTTGADQYFHKGYGKMFLMR